MVPAGVRFSGSAAGTVVEKQTGLTSPQESLACGAGERTWCQWRGCHGSSILRGFTEGERKPLQKTLDTQLVSFGGRVWADGAGEPCGSEAPGSDGWTAWEA